MEVENAHHHPAGQEEHLPGRGRAGSAVKRSSRPKTRFGKQEEEELEGDQQEGEGDEGAEDVD